MCVSLTQKAQWLDHHKEVIHIHRRWDGTRSLMYHSKIEYCNSLEQMIEIYGSKLTCCYNMITGKSIYICPTTSAFMVM